MLWSGLPEVGAQRSGLAFQRTQFLGAGFHAQRVEQFLEITVHHRVKLVQRQPDAVIACVGGGSNAMGLFYPFFKDKSVKFIGVEGAGLGLGCTFGAFYSAIPSLALNGWVYAVAMAVGALAGSRIIRRLA